VTRLVSALRLLAIGLLFLTVVAQAANAARLFVDGNYVFAVAELVGAGLACLAIRQAERMTA
jgi:hypothetical protein